VPDLPGVRLDTGYTDGDAIGVHYDPLLAKVIAHAPTRAEALRLLAGTLDRTRLHGPPTNRDLLVRSLRHEEFASGTMTTAFYDRHVPALTAAENPGEEPLAAVAAALADAALPRSAERHPQGDTGVPRRIGGWRNVPSQAQVKRYRGRDVEHEVQYRYARGALVTDGVRVVRVSPDLVVLDVDGVQRTFEVARYGDQVFVNHTALTVLPRFPDPTATRAPGSLLAPMPGTVVRLAEGLAEGARVEAGQPLLWLEAMKMEHRISAPASGTLTALHAAPGRQVEVGALLAVVAAEPPDPADPSDPADPPDPADATDAAHRTPVPDEAPVQEEQPA
jgi:propionyl-CoA carboxylase alpha chain